MSHSTIFRQMHIQPIRLEVLRSHAAMLNDPMLLGQILLREARSVRGAVGELLAYELVHPVGLLVGGAG